MIRRPFRFFLGFFNLTNHFFSRCIPLFFTFGAPTIIPIKRIRFYICIREILIFYVHHYLINCSLKFPILFFGTRFTGHHSYDKERHYTHPNTQSRNSCMPLILLLKFHAKFFLFIVFILNFFFMFHLLYSYFCFIGILTLPFQNNLATTILTEKSI